MANHINPLSGAKELPSDKMGEVEFSSWLQEQLDSRGWRPTDLARHARLSDTAISRILRGQRKADTESLSAIAKALNMDPIDVYRHAGKLPKSNNHDEADELRRQILRETQNMPEQDQQEVLAFIRMKNNIRNQRKGK